MNKKHSLTNLILFVASALSLHGQAMDDVLLNVKKQRSILTNLVAKDVNAHIEIFDGDGKNIDTVDKKTQLTGWKNGEPLRTVTSLTETQKSPLGDAKLDFGLADHPERDLLDILSAVRQEDTNLGSKPCHLFQVTGKRKNKTPFTGKIWVEIKTGLPLRADYVYDPSSIPMTKSMSYSVEYGRSQAGDWLPKTVSIDVLMSMLFVKAKMLIKQDLDGWMARP